MIWQAMHSLSLQVYHSHLTPHINTLQPSLLVSSPAVAPSRTQLRCQLSVGTWQLVSSLPDSVFSSVDAFIIDMRMTDWEAGQAVRARLEPLGRTGLSIIYAEKSNPTIAIKAAGFWLDGEMYDRAAFAENASETFKREATIYEALGPHPHILKCLGAAYLRAGEETNQKEMEAWAVRLERAPHGSLRERILEDEPPSMTCRLQLAVDLAETLQYIHDRGVIWGDISARNILVFDDLHIKLSDFAGSSLRDVYPELHFTCEPRYWVPETTPPTPTKDVFAKELFALGTGICEITEWAVPYGELEIEELQERLMKGEYPHVSEDNPVGSIIRKLWHSGYSSAKEAADALREVAAQLNVTTE